MMCGTVFVSVTIFPIMPHLSGSASHVFTLWSLVAVTGLGTGEVASSAASNNYSVVPKPAFNLIEPTSRSLTDSYTTLVSAEVLADIPV
jgi:hypothetical protein